MRKERGENKTSEKRRKLKSTKEDKREEKRKK